MNSINLCEFLCALHDNPDARKDFEAITLKIADNSQKGAPDSDGFQRVFDINFATQYQLPFFIMNNSGIWEEIGETNPDNICQAFLPMNSKGIYGMYINAFQKLERKRAYEKQTGHAIRDWAESQNDLAVEIADWYAKHVEKKPAESR
ncbi:MAG: hypothetical protein ABIE22_05540 [archaeon]